MAFLLLSVRVRRAHRDPKDAVGPEEVPSVLFFPYCDFPTDQPLVMVDSPSNFTTNNGAFAIHRVLLAALVRLVWLVSLDLQSVTGSKRESL